MLTLDDVNGKRTDEQTLARTISKRLSVSVVIDREDPGSVVVYSVHKWGWLSYEGSSLRRAVDIYNQPMTEGARSALRRLLARN